MKQKALVSFLAIVAAILLGALPASAKISQMSLLIDGLACPFCVHGIEKKLRSVDGISDVSVDLETGKADLTLAEGKTPSLSAIQAAVEKAGFTLREVNATIVGIPTVEGHSVRLHERGSTNDYLLFERGTGQEQPVNADLQARLVSLADKGTLAVVSGVLLGRADGTLTLVPSSVEEIGQFPSGAEGTR